MYNFANSKLCLKVSTDSAAMDNYEVENLISDNFLVKSRGFLAYTSIKPPVIVDFELICPIRIHYIVLSTTLGSQKSTGIEILVKDSTAVTSVAHASYTEPGIVFCNARMYSKKKPPPLKENDFYIAYFRSNSFHAFSNASVIKVKITRTEKSVPCLQKVEIWGEVAKTCSETTRNTINRIMNKTDIGCKQSPTLLDAAEADRREEFEIPEDFKDAITFETMTMPMTLPSGQTVDQVTLEKHNRNESLYGRHCSDPFTGLVFTDARKPVLNVALKSRIDLFLLQNSHQPETFNLKRTLGRNPEQNVTDCFNYKQPRLSSDNSDLDTAIKKAMSSKQFTHFTASVGTSKSNDALKKKCVMCQSDSNLYVIPCEHFYCRKCVMEICVRLTCGVCNAPFVRNDPRKIHVD